MAIKKFNGPFSSEEVRLFKEEVKVLGSLYNSFCCMFLGTYVSEEELYIITELMDGNLETLLKNVKFSLFQKLRLARDAARVKKKLKIKN